MHSINKFYKKLPRSIELLRCYARISLTRFSITILRSVRISMRAFTLAICTLLFACTNPYPVSVPKPGNYHGITLNADYDALVKNVHNYGEELSQKSHKLQSQKYAYTDFGYLGSIVSVIAAASGALTTALYSGGAAVGGGMAAQHYNYDSQIQNYSVARKKVQCIYRKLNERTVNESLLIKFDTHSDIARILTPSINNALDDIYFELDSKQSSIDLKTPDLKLLADAFSKQKEISPKIASLNNGPLPINNYENKSKNEEARIILAQNIQMAVSICKVLGDAPQGE